MQSKKNNNNSPKQINDKRGLSATHSGHPSDMGKLHLSSCRFRITNFVMLTLA